MVEVCVWRFVCEGLCMEVCVWRFCFCSLFYDLVLYVLSSFAIISLRNRELKLGPRLLNLFNAQLN